MRLRAWQSPSLLLWPSAALAPLINVVLLLVGFVLQSPAFGTSTGVSLQLPHAVTAEAVGAGAVVITVTDQHLIYLNGLLTTMDELPTRLTPLLTETRAVLIKADRQVPLGLVASLWDVCRQRGATHIAMATTTPPA